MHVLVPVPTAADLPAAQFVQSAPAVEILPTAHQWHAENGETDVSPAAQSVHAAPAADFLPAAQSMHVLVLVPTAADVPEAQFVQSAPAVEILPTAQLTQFVNGWGEV